MLQIYFLEIQFLKGLIIYLSILKENSKKYMLVENIIEK